MKLSYIPLALAALLVISFMLGAQEQPIFPRMTSVDPGTAKAGAEVAVGGENLDKANVSKVYLTSGDKDTEVPVTEQAATSIKIKIPESVKPGRFSLTILTTAKPQRLIEQPVRLNIE